ncbi:NAD-binding protein [Halobium salinum]|uniref:NAD-binding protein n=1 Tax=Halobium salinum TaxID=1364940 RepID=A0ABD5P934_9EURY|nr:NAD-binding protein [Halobium salinum]
MSGTDTKKAVVSGADADGLGEALEDEGVEVTRVEGVATGESLDAAGIDDADLFVVTDADDATAVSIAKDRNPDVKVVFYAHDSLPEFAKGQADLAVDPDLLAADVVAEELV